MTSILESPLFIPLKSEYFEAFVRGEKTIEYRRYGKRWNAKTCRVNRRVTISNGYGKKNRSHGVITDFASGYMSSDEWLDCYGTRGIAACTEILLDDFAGPLGWIGPRRHQRTRRKGARLPDGVKCVTRPGKWGNPFDTAEQFNWWMRRLLHWKLREIPAGMIVSDEQFCRMRWIADHIDELRDIDLACFCSLASPCHADSLLHFANRGPQ